MENTKNQPSEEKISELLGGFKSKYYIVLHELDKLYQGVFDETEAPGMAAMCLIAQASLFSVLSASEFQARALKRDIEFAKAEAFSKLKQQDGKKMTDALVTQLVTKDDEVKRISLELNQAEREAKELANILALLKEAHLTFRSIKKGI
jgi:hypothetical protein